MLDINESLEVAEFMRARHQYGGELFAEALNEIEQLRFKLGETLRDLIKARTSNLALKKVTIYQAARIRELKDDLETAKASIKFDGEEIDRLQAEIKKAKENLSDYWQVHDEQIANIRELRTQNDDLMKHCNNLRNRAQKAEFKVVKREKTMQEERARLIARCEYDCPEGGCLVSEETISTTVKAFGKVLQIDAYKQLWDEHKIGLNASIAHQECQKCDDEFCDEDEYPKETRQ